MKKAMYVGHTEDKRGIVLKAGTSDEPCWLEIDEPLLRELDRLLIEREAASDEAGSTTMKEPDVDAEDSDDGGVARANGEETTGTLEAIPNKATEAITAVREWIPEETDSGRDHSVEVAVSRNLKARMIELPDELFDGGWRADRRKGGGWLVTFNVLIAGQARTAEWVVDDVRREIRALNDLASELQTFSAEKARVAATRAKPKLGRRRKN